MGWTIPYDRGMDEKTRAIIQRALEALEAPTHGANDFNCQDWPPGEGCRGCNGNELRRKSAEELRKLLSE